MVVMNEIEITIYDKREKSTTTLTVEKLSDNHFRMTENDLFNCNLTFGTEFETRINSDGNYEIIRITKKSEFITRRFMLTKEFAQSDYRLLADELHRLGGFWQVDMGGIATINIPKDFPFDVDKVMADFNIRLTEIVED
jgi:hypothetical protein